MSSNATVTVDDVKAALVETLGLEDRAGAIDAGTRLFGALPELDSMAVLELITVLEDRFGILVDADDVTEDIFETLASLTAFVAAKRG